MIAIVIIPIEALSDTGPWKSISIQSIHCLVFTAMNFYIAIFQVLDVLSINGYFITHDLNNSFFFTVSVPGNNDLLNFFFLFLHLFLLFYLFIFLGKGWKSYCGQYSSQYKIYSKSFHTIIFLIFYVLFRRPNIKTFFGLRKVSEMLNGCR